jgi:hypothetical protein
MVESLATYYRRNADRERRMAAQLSDPALRRFHLQKAELLDRKAVAAG